MPSSENELTDGSANSAEILLKDLSGGGTTKLLYESIPKIISKLQPIPGKVLDFGCGTGYSTRILKQCGLETIGVDTSPQMLQQARILDPTGEYEQIERTILPFAAYSFPLVFSSLVFLEMTNRAELAEAFAEISMVLADKGIFIMCTASPELADPKHKWLSIDNNYPENSKLCSGKKFMLLIKELNLELIGYHWTEDDYLTIARQSGFLCLEIIRPMVKDLPNSDSLPWLSETTVAPFVIYILKKIK